MRGHALPVLPVPVLMFHDVLPGPGTGNDPYAVDREQLGRLLEVLVADGWRSASFAELTAPAPETGSASAKRRGPRSVVLTFDDARQGVLEQALPLLAAHGLTGVVYAIAGRLGQPGFLDAAGLTDLHRAGWTIGTHTVTHRHLTGLTRAEVREEWTRSRHELEDRLGAAVLDGSLPGGRGGPREAEEARAAGLHSLATSRPGRWQPATGPWAIPRIVCGAGLQPARLRPALAGELLGYLLPALGRYTVLGLAKTLLGDPRYDALRHRLRGWTAGAQG